jgi:hypothetical protein
VTVGDDVKDLEGNGCAVIIIPAFVWGDWGKPHETSVRTVSVPAEI